MADRVSDITVWTLVRHPVFVHSGKALFEHAVDAKPVPRTQAQAILDAGGVIAETAQAAFRLVEHYNYPPDHSGLRPMYVGAYNENLTVDGLPLAVPRRGQAPGPAGDG
jgi:MOSC domain-containing protein YiiM